MTVTMVLDVREGSHDKFLISRLCAFVHISVRPVSPRPAPPKQSIICFGITPNLFP